MIPLPSWFPTGMTWWEAVLWTLLEIAIFFGVPVGLVALSAPLEHWGGRIASTWRRWWTRVPQ